MVISAAALSRIKSPVPGVVDRQVKVKKLFISFAANRQTDVLFCALTVYRLVVNHLKGSHFLEGHESAQNHG